MKIYLDEYRVTERNQAAQDYVDAKRQKVLKDIALMILVIFAVSIVVYFASAALPKIAHDMHQHDAFAALYSEGF